MNVANYWTIYSPGGIAESFEAKLTGPCLSIGRSTSGWQNGHGFGFSHGFKLSGGSIPETLSPVSVLPEDPFW
jgi:hypothetical protein